MTTNDMELLREYTRHKSEEAFATLVSRYVNLVYSVASRQVHDLHLAEEITQAVFIILARKAESLGDKTILSGWLCRTARYVSSNALTIQRRRQLREQEAYMQSIMPEPEPDAWPQIAPLLDAALAQLNQKDHNAIALRFFENKDFKQVGAALGSSEDAAKKRVNRAVEKLQKFFLNRGVHSTASAIAGGLSANSIQTAPALLAQTVTAAALAKGATTSLSTLTLIKGATKLMAWTKAKTAVVIGVVAILAAGTTTVAINKFRTPSVEEVFKHYSNQKYLDKAPVVSILRPTHYGDQGNWINGTTGRILGRSRSMSWVLAVAYDSGIERMIFPPDLPAGQFDYLITASSDPKAALREEIKKQFGLVAHSENITTNVFVLKVAKPGAAGLRVSHGRLHDDSMLSDPGNFVLTHAEMSGMAEGLGGYYLNMPVIDETGLTGYYDMKLQWDGSLHGSDQLDAIKQTLQDQLGLELVQEQRSVEMFVVEYQDGPTDYTPRAGSDLQGYWKGSEQMGINTVRPNPWPVILKITEPSAGRFRALWRRPWLNSQFVAASSVTYAPPKIRVEVAALPGVFEGEINGSHTEIKGTWTYRTNAPHPVTLSLSDPKTESERQAAFEAQKNYTPAGPNDLAGYWKVPNEPDLDMSIARIYGGKFFCSLTRPGWIDGIDATLVRYTPPAVHLEWGWGGISTFDGKIENGQLIGTLQQGRRGKPQEIVFERSTAQ